MLRSTLIVCVRGLSLFFRALGSRACRFEPSCSQYAVEAIRSLSVPAAVWTSAKRICRCHPFHPGGYDPLPITDRS